MVCAYNLSLLKRGYNNMTPYIENPIFIFTPGRMIACGNNIILVIRDIIMHNIMICMGKL